MKNALYFSFGIFSYLVFLVSLIYAIGFVGNFWVPNTIDGEGTTTVANALLIDSLLLGLFAISHSVMARQWFKRWWTRIIPRPIERSIYVLVSSLILLLIFWQWRPIDHVIWNLEGTVWYGVLYGLYFIGWAIVFISTFLIDHFDLFGLRQVWLKFRNKEYAPPRFQNNLFYRWVRHPLLLGFIIAFWAAPVMTVGHLFFSLATTAYMLIGIQLEERDLIKFHGDRYRKYRKQVSMIIPMPPRDR